ncbi:MAG: hypothetical protein ACK56F_00155, partial [bacterium]
MGREGRGRGEHRASKWRRHPSHSTRCPHPNRTCTTTPHSHARTRACACTRAQQHMVDTWRCSVRGEAHAYAR